MRQIRSGKGMAWSKFWWKDYDRDPALRTCSLEAEALWMRLLCIMAESEPYGLLLVRGAVPSNRQIARIVGRGLTERRTARLMAELLERGVYSLDETGVPYCRRMLREQEVRAKAQVHGAKGGNPVLMSGEKTAEKRANSAAEPTQFAGGVSSETNDLFYAGVNPNPNPKDKLQEERGEKKSTVAVATDAAASGDDPVKRMWREGLALLAKATGFREPKARQLLAAMRQAAGDDPGAVMDAIEAVAQRRPTNPWPWAVETAAMRNPRRPRPAQREHRLSGWARELGLSGDEDEPRPASAYDLDLRPEYVQ